MGDLGAHQDREPGMSRMRADLLKCRPRCDLSTDAQREAHETTVFRQGHYPAPLMNDTTTEEHVQGMWVWKQIKDLVMK